MTKKIVILSSTPRRGGNSERLCEAFQRGASEAGQAAEIIRLREQRIGYCTACDACQKNGGRCVIQDDMAPLLDKLIAAEVIVLATPVYFYTLSAQLKTVIDRCYARYTAISDKEFYFLVTAAVGQKQLLERTVESLRGFTACLDGAKERGIVYGSGVWHAGDIQQSPALGQAYDLGKNV